jgi:polar amino acid transport system substrate-binding protein
MYRRLFLTLLLSVCASAVAAQTLRIGVSPDYPPLAYLAEGRVVGIEADNARAVSEIIGQPMKMVQMPFKELIPALEAGRIDVIMSGMSVTDERAGRVTFIDPYMQMGQMAIMHRDKVAQFAQPWAVYREGVRIGVEPGTTGARFAADELKDARVSFYENAEAAFQGLRRDEIDLYIHDAPTSWQLATTSENEDIISLYSPLTDEMLAWAVRQGDDGLAEELNRALRLMKGNGTLRYILNRHIPVTVEVR